MAQLPPRRRGRHGGGEAVRVGWRDAVKLADSLGSSLGLTPAGRALGSAEVAGAFSLAGHLDRHLSVVTDDGQESEDATPK